MVVALVYPDLVRAFLIIYLQGVFFIFPNCVNSFTVCVTN